jgi:hypothetical protein
LLLLVGGLLLQGADLVVVCLFELDCGSDDCFLVLEFASQ